MSPTGVSWGEAARTALVPTIVIFICIVVGVMMMSIYGTWKELGIYKPLVDLLNTPIGWGILGGFAVFGWLILTVVFRFYLPPSYEIGFVIGKVRSSVAGLTTK